MNSDVKVVPLERVTAPALAVALGSQIVDGKVPSSLLGLDSQLQGAISRILESGDFKGERDDFAAIYPAKGPKRVLLIGLGKPSDINRAALRRAAAIAARKTVALGIEHLAFFVPHESRGGIPPAVVGQMLVEGAAHGSWQFKELKATDDKRSKLKSFEIIGAREERADLDRGRRIGAAIGIGQKLARNLQMLPGNVCTPTYLTEIARLLGKAYGFKVTALDRNHLEKAGKPIELVNTDAEGRLILADALSYVRRFKPACVIDAATLTGAIVIGLGHTAVGLMGNDEQLMNEVRKAGELAGERCWPLPLWDEFRDLNKSDVADVKNSGGRAAGSITAGW